MVIITISNQNLWYCMTTKDKNEAYEKILIANLQRTNDFLKFAEAKNAALLAIASGWIIAIINLLCSDKIISDCFKCSIVIALFLSILAALFAMFSFLPRLNLPAFLGGKRAGPHSKNLLYYGDIASLPIKTLQKDIQLRYMPTSNGFTKDYINDLIVQLSVNSEITMRKMCIFRAGMWLMLLSGMTLLLSVLIPIISMVYKSVSVTW